jgi:hypothetical protein
MSNNIGTSFSVSSNGRSGYTTGGLGGLQFMIPGIGRDIYVNNNPINGIKLGGGMQGYVPQSVLTNYRTDEFAVTRFYLKNAWNTTSESGSSNPKRIITPFRAVNNAGDILSRQNYSCGGSCQTPQSRPGLHGLSNRFGNVSISCTPSVIWSLNQVDPKIPASSCNTKFVYDGSDYIEFKKKQAINRNFNDRSFGGNDYSGAQSATRAIRRY